MARILMIDDDKGVCAATKIVLEANGFEVVTVGDGKSGIDAIKNDQFDLVICDLFLPGMNGLEATKAIRAIRPRMPIITASGFMFRHGEVPEMPNFEAMAEEAGATTTLYKPFRPKDLLQAIKRTMEMAA